LGLAIWVHGRLVTDAERGVDGFDEAATRAVPRNFVLVLVSYVFMKVGDVLANPKTVLAWLVTGVGAPAFVVGLLVPVRESGALVPQLWLTSLVASVPRRKWLWVTGALGQGAAMAAIGLTALVAEGALAGAAILVALAVFALSRALGSLSTKDVVAKTIPQGQRGQLSGLSTGAAGLIGLAGGLAMLALGGPVRDVDVLALLVVAAGALWAIAAAAYARIVERPSAPDGAGDRRRLTERLALVGRDRGFRDFVVTRTALIATALMTPYVVVIGHREIGTSILVLGTFVVADGVAAMVGAPLWGRLADVSSKRVLRLSGALAGVTGVGTAAIAAFSPVLAGSHWCLPSAYFVLALAHAGVRVGRSTYLVDFADDEKRTDYVAVSNTLIGLLLLGVGAVGLLEGMLTLPGVVALLAVLGLAGAAYAGRLPEATARPAD